MLHARYFFGLVVALSTAEAHCASRRVFPSLQSLNEQMNTARLTLEHALRCAVTTKATPKQKEFLLRTAQTTYFAEYLRAAAAYKAALHSATKKEHQAIDNEINRLQMQLNELSPFTEKLK